MSVIVIYLVLGAFAGTIAGLLGVGGGLVLVPALIHVLPFTGIAEQHVMHLAIGTSLATIIVTSLSSVRAHHLRGYVIWPILKRIIPGVIVGALLGAWIADFLDTAALSRVFSLFIILAALQMGMDIKPQARRRIPKWPGLVSVGGLVGGLSSLVGVGGGSLMVPFLAWCNVSMHRAIGTSAAIGLPIAVAGSIGFMIMGWNEQHLPEHSSGYIYWPAFLGIAFASVMCAPLGAALAHRLKTAWLKKIFALVLVIIGLEIMMTS